MPDTKKGFSIDIRYSGHVEKQFFSVAKGDDAFVLTEQGQSDPIMMVEPLKKQFTIDNTSHKFDAISKEDIIVLPNISNVVAQYNTDFTITVDTDQGKRTLRVSHHELSIKVGTTFEPLVKFDKPLDVSLPESLPQQITNGDVRMTSFPAQMADVLVEEYHYETLKLDNGMVVLKSPDGKIIFPDGTKLSTANFADIVHAPSGYVLRFLPETETRKMKENQVRKGIGISEETAKEFQKFIGKSEDLSSVPTLPSDSSYVKLRNSKSAYRIGEDAKKDKDDALGVKDSSNAKTEETTKGSGEEVEVVNADAFMAEDDKKETPSKEDESSQVAYTVTTDENIDVSTITPDNIYDVPNYTDIKEEKDDTKDKTQDEEKSESKDKEETTPSDTESEKTDKDNINYHVTTDENIDTTTINPTNYDVPNYTDEATAQKSAETSTVNKTDGFTVPNYTDEDKKEETKTEEDTVKEAETKTKTTESENKVADTNTVNYTVETDENVNVSTINESADYNVPNYTYDDETEEVKDDTKTETTETTETKDKEGSTNEQMTEKNNDEEVEVVNADAFMAEDNKKETPSKENENDTVDYTISADENTDTTTYTPTTDANYTNYSNAELNNFEEKNDTAKTVKETDKTSFSTPNYTETTEEKAQETANNGESAEDYYTVNSDNKNAMDTANSYEINTDSLNAYKDVTSTYENAENGVSADYTTLPEDMDYSGTTYTVGTNDDTNNSYEYIANPGQDIKHGIADTTQSPESENTNDQNPAQESNEEKTQENPEGTTTDKNTSSTDGDADGSSTSASTPTDDKETKKPSGSADGKDSGKFTTDGEKSGNKNNGTVPPNSNSGAPQGASDKSSGSGDKKDGKDPKKQMEQAKFNLMHKGLRIILLVAAANLFMAAFMLANPLFGLLCLMCVAGMATSAFLQQTMKPGQFSSLFSIGGDIKDYIDAKHRIKELTPRQQRKLAKLMKKSQEKKLSNRQQRKLDRLSTRAEKGMSDVEYYNWKKGEEYLSTLPSFQRVQELRATAEQQNVLFIQSKQQELTRLQQEIAYREKYLAVGRNVLPEKVQEFINEDINSLKKYVKQLNKFENTADKTNTNQIDVLEAQIRKDVQQAIEKGEVPPMWLDEEPKLDERTFEELTQEDGLKSPSLHYKTDILKAGQDELLKRASEAQQEKPTTTPENEIKQIPQIDMTKDNDDGFTPTLY